VELQPGTTDAPYLEKLSQALDAAAVLMPQPHVIIYNAGTDILAGDPLGRWATAV
jgi:histone deacetylase 11